MSGAYNQPQFIENRMSQRLAVEQKRVEKENQPGSASGHYATFAMQWNFGDQPFCTWWILRDDESWHEAVRGDGHSYSPGGPSDMFPTPGESISEFRRRVVTASRAA